MKVVLATLYILLFVSQNCHAFLGELTNAVEKGVLEMTETGVGQFDTVFQCPPFKNRQESSEAMKQQIADFCGGEIKIIKELYEKNPKGSDKILATIKCLNALNGSSDDQLEIVKTDASQQKPAAGTTTDQAPPPPIISIKPDKTKIILKKRVSTPPVQEEQKQEISSVEQTEKSIPAEPKKTIEQLPTETKEYLAELKSTVPEVFRDAAKKTYYNNVNEPALFDAVEQILLTNYRNDRGKIHTDGMGWLCKVLGGSGLDKYRGTLDKIANSGVTFKLRWHAALQRDKLDKTESQENQTAEQQKIEIEQKLVKLKELHDEGLITDSEYSQKKALLLEQL